MISWKWLRSAIGATVLIFGLASQAGAAFPDRPITLVVPWAAGGGTDAVARYIAAVLQEDLGQPVNVVNRTGGNGVVGHSAIATAQPDGYTIGLITLEINMMHWMGLTDLTHESYTPLALMNADPAAIHVRTDSDFETLEELVEAIKANPGKFKSSGTSQGGSWHLALAGMLHSLGADPNSTQWIPSTGAATAMTDLAAGGVDLVSCSLPEARALMDAGRVRSLAVMAEERSAVFPDVPTLKEATGSTWTKGVWRGMVGPKGLPEDIANRYEELFKKIYESEGFKKFMADRGFETVWADADGFAEFMKRDNAEIGEMMKLMGLTK